MKIQKKYLKQKKNTLDNKISKLSTKKKEKFKKNNRMSIYI